MSCAYEDRIYGRIIQILICICTAITKPEVPLCVNEAELNQIAEAYARSGRILTVGFNRRYSPFAADCTDLFKGRIGPLSMLYRVNAGRLPRDRKSTRLNSSHVEISYAVFCLKKKKKNKTIPRLPVHHRCMNS